jgi:hypothetical protein
MYGMMPREKTAKFDIAPPLKRSRNPKIPSSKKC